MEDDFQIGEWLISPQLSRIQRQGEEIQVELKAMEVLVYLAHHPKELVRKARLMQAVWPDTFVTDTVLTHAISELRRAFRDDAKSPQHGSGSRIHGSGSDHGNSSRIGVGPRQLFLQEYFSWILVPIIALRSDFEGFKTHCKELPGLVPPRLRHLPRRPLS